MQEQEPKILQRKKPKISVKSVLRELRNIKRRRGGMRRARFEMIAGMAWQMAWEDDFQQSPVAYMSLAHEFERERQQQMIERFQQGYQEYKRKRGPKLRVIDGGRPPWPSA
jgi:hypothetical protein